jgi:hypothetical protein
MMSNLMRRRIVKPFAIIFIIITIFFASFWIYNYIYIEYINTPVPYVVHTPVQKKHQVSQPSLYQPIWTLDQVNLLWDGFDDKISAAAGYTCYLGGGGISPHGGFACIDSKIGNVLWEGGSDENRSIVVSSGGVYVTNFKTLDGNLKVNKFNLQDGGIIWSQKLSERWQKYFTRIDNQVQVLTNPGHFWAFDADGNLNKKIDDQYIYASRADKSFLEERGNLKAIKTDTKEELWVSDPGYFIHVPLFTQDKIFTISGKWGQGYVTALDQQTGKILWKTDENIVSNVVYSPEKHIVYALHINGDLLSFDESTGKQNIVANFTGYPFTRNKDGVLGCQLAYDAQERILIVATADSSQLFGFKEN